MMRRDFQSTKYGMKAIVEKFANEKTKVQFKDSAHGALCDAKTLAVISTTSTIGERFKNWLMFDSDYGAVMRQRPSTQYLPG